MRRLTRALVELDASASWYLACGMGIVTAIEELQRVEKLFVDRLISSRGSDLHMTEICKGIEGVQVVLRRAQAPARVKISAPIGCHELGRSPIEIQEIILSKSIDPTREEYPNTEVKSTRNVNVVRDGVSSHLI